MILVTDTFCVKQINLIRFQRAKQTEDGYDIYLWYFVSESQAAWRIAKESEFEARTNIVYMYIESEGKQEPFFTSVMKLIFIDHITKYFRV